MKLTRRGFLIGSALAGTGLALGIKLSPSKPVPHTRDNSFQPNVWLQITPEGEVIFQCDKNEMGQGAMTGLAMIVAEELDYDPHSMTVEFAGIHPAFFNPELGVQLTGASTSIKTSWERLREAGATARAMLIEAAAQQWQVSADSLSTEPGFVINPNTKAKLSYGELANAAQNVSEPSSVNLKSPEQFRWLGKTSKRLDIESKVNTTAVFGVDVDLPDLKTAVVIRCPHFGGKFKSYDASTINGFSGLLGVKEIHSGIAVIAETYWQARKAADELAKHVVWDKGPLAGVNNASIEQAQLDILNSPEDTAFYVTQDGDTAETLAATSEDKKLSDVVYKVGYFHHSPMEPQNATAHFDPSTGEINIWAPNQSPDMSRAVAAHFTGVEHEKIFVHSTYMGGGFGRRGYVDFAGEAAAIAKSMPGVNIKMMWSREDDMQHDYYRPTSMHKLSAALDENNNLSAWKYNIVSNSIFFGFGVDMFATLLPHWLPTKMARKIGRSTSDFVANYDITMAEGAKGEYDTPNLDVGINFYDSGIPTGFWRSVGHSYTGFVKESMVDEMANLAGEDPMAFRLKQMENAPRSKACLEKVKQLSNWDAPKPGVYRGVACHESFSSFVAQVVEIKEENVNGKVQAKVDKVYCVADVGFVLNPDVVKDQLTGGIVYGLTAAIKPHVKIEDGRVQGSNFHDMPVLRMNECPDFEVALIDSLEDPTGVGEISVPPIGGALANALFAFNGVRQRQMPLNLDKAAEVEVEAKTGMKTESAS